MLWVVGFSNSAAASIVGACLATTVPANHSGASTALPWTGKHIKTKMQLGTPDVKCDQRRGFRFSFNRGLHRETEEYIATPTTPPVDRVKLERRM